MRKSTKYPGDRRVISRYTRVLRKIPGILPIWPKIWLILGPNQPQTRLRAQNLTISTEFSRENREEKRGCCREKRKGKQTGCERQSIYSLTPDPSTSPRAAPRNLGRSRAISGDLASRGRAALSRAISERRSRDGTPAQKKEGPGWSHGAHEDVLGWARRRSSRRTIRRGAAPRRRGRPST